jgi:hypothetical protein
LDPPSGAATEFVLQRYSGSRDKAPRMLYPATGRLIPFNSNPYGVLDLCQHDPAQS